MASIRRSVLVGVVGFGVVTLMAIAGGCGGDDAAPAVTPDGATGADATGVDGQPQTSDGSIDAKPCTGLCLRQKSCATGTTSLTGVVRDPAGKVPLYNVLVYIPNEPVAPITTGASCDRCAPPPGALVSTFTGSDGRFKLDNVPVGADVPLVVQVGKWRRQIVVPNVPECVETPLDAEVTRMPRKKSEGDLPQMAITTGGADVMECWLRKVGIDDSEFTTGTGAGRVHLYAGGGGPLVTTSFAPTHENGSLFSSATDLWSSSTNLAKYDVVMLSCEGTTVPATKPPAALDAMKTFTSAGGRLLATHWHRYWFDTAAMAGSNPQPAGAPSPFEPFATWKDRGDPPNPSFGTINTTFPKGQALEKLLGNVNALTDGGLLRIEDSRHNVDAVDPAKATSWVTIPSSPTASVVGLTVDTPIAAAKGQKCGRIVYSDLHASDGDNPGPWPQGCVTIDLNPQEKALEFLLFELSTCIE